MVENIEILRTKLEAEKYELRFKISKLPNETNKSELTTPITVTITDLYGNPLENKNVTISLEHGSKGGLGEKYGKKVNGTTNGLGKFTTDYTLNLENIDAPFWGLETIKCNKKRIQIYIDGSILIPYDKMKLKVYKDFGVYILDSSYCGRINITGANISMVNDGFQDTTVTFFSYSKNAFYLVYNHRVWALPRSGITGGNEYSIGIFRKAHSQKELYYVEEEV